MKNIALLLGVIAIVFACGQPKSGQEGTSADQVSNEATQQEELNQDGRMAERMSQRLIEDLAKRGTELDSAQIEQINAIVNEMTPKDAKTRSEFRAIREQIRERVLNDVLTREQRLAREALREEDGQ